MSDYEIDYDIFCPNCEYTPTRYRRCSCDDGLVYPYEEDPLNFSPDETEPCDECDGSGLIRWCPMCGKTITSWDVARQEGEEC